MGNAFVIHTHSDHGPVHYDLMLEHGEALATWQLLGNPCGLEVGQTIQAVKLLDHRTVYLTYEGPVSHGRGRVDRLDKGAYELVSAEADRWVVRLFGRLVHGQFQLTRDADSQDHWQLCFRGPV